MAAMERIRVKLARARAQSLQSGRVVLGVPAVTGTVQAVCHFLLGSVLSGGIIFRTSAPFGLALVGAAGSGINAAAALMGACFGYVTLLGLIEGLRYVSAAILTFSVAFAFYDVKLYRAAWTMPVAAAVMNGCTGFIYLSQQGWRTRDVICFVLEVILTALFAYGFRGALTPEDDRSIPDSIRRLGQALLLAAILISFAHIKPVADISLGRIAAGMIVLLSAWQSGMGTGAALGVLLGLAMDLAHGGQNLYAMTFGTAGLAGGLFQGRRTGCTAVFLLSGLSAVLWTWDGGVRVSALYELIAAGVLLSLVPSRWISQLGTALIREQTETSDGTRDYVTQRLQAAAQAFRTLHDTMRTTFRRLPANENDTAVVFDRAADRVCRSCAMRSTCWERDYVTTFNALNDASPAMLSRGRSLPEDLPQHFTARCIRLREFLAAINEELTGLLCRRQYGSRIRDSRRTVCSQYGQLSQMLSEAAAELGQSLTPDPVRQRRLRQHLAMLGLDGDAAVFYDQEHHLRVRICGSAAKRLARPEELPVLSDLMELPLRPEENDRADVLTFAQSEPYMAVAGIAARKKDGQTVSGDAGTWFRQPDGKLYVLLCDGMGSGPDANRESGLAVRLLEQFLKAGVEAENALAVLSSALSLRGEDEGGFTTVDLLQLDLFSGQAAIYKLGAAPSYIKTAAAVRRISGDSLPAGACEPGSRPDCTRLRLAPEDWVIMVSDGICGDGDDTALREHLTRFDGTSPKELAKAILDECGADSTDDRTVLAVRFVHRT